jgi:hypothetical protein
MCDVSLIAVGLTLASAAVGTYSALESQKQSNKQADTASALAQQNYNLEAQRRDEVYADQVAAQQLDYERQSTDAALQYQRGLNLEANQLNAQDAQYALLSKKTNEAASTAAVRAGEGGVGGLSVDTMMSDYYRQELDSRLALDTDRNSIAMQGSNSYYDYKTGQTRLNQDYTTSSKNMYTNLMYGSKSGDFSFQNNMNRINDSRISNQQTGLSIASTALNSGASYYSMTKPSVSPSRLPSSKSPVSNKLSARPVLSA